MYTLPHLKRVQDYLLRNAEIAFLVFHNPDDLPPVFAGFVDVTFRASEYVQRGSLLVMDKDGIHKELVDRLVYDDPMPGAVQHHLFAPDDLSGLAARESL